MMYGSDKFREWKRRQERLARVREVVESFIAGILWLLISAGLIWVCCAVSGYHWE